MKHITFLIVLTVLFFCSCGTNATKSELTAEMAYEGVSNYCHSAYDWSMAEANPSMMYVEMGEETETEYQVVFRSYTGAFVYFYVEKSSGTTRMVEYVPALDIKEEAGVIDIFDYVECCTTKSRWKNDGKNWKLAGKITVKSRNSLEKLRQNIEKSLEICIFAL